LKVIAQNIRRFVNYFIIEQGKVEEFAQAIGDPNPVYGNLKAVKQQGYKNTITPPAFGVCIEM